jgi:putative oxidoreductase
MSFGESISPFLGRVVLAWFFLFEAYVRARDWSGTVSLLAMKDVPAPAVLHFVTIVALMLGAASLFLGFRTRLGALGLFGFTIIANVLMHDYWHIANLIDRQADYDMFARNMAIAGGLLLLVGMGPGRFALDNRGGGKRR